MDTKRIIVEAMRKLLKTRKFEKITVQDVLDEAHVSRGTFYRHFKDKYEIMNFFYHESIRDIIADLKMSNKAKTQAIVNSVLESKDYFDGVVDTEGINSFKTFVHMCSKQFYISVYLQKRMAGNTEPIPQDIDFMSDFLAGGCATTIDKWVIGKADISKEELVESLYKMTPEEFR